MNMERVDLKQVLAGAKEVTDSNKSFSGSGLVLLKNYSAGTTSTGNPKFIGIVANMEEMPFSVWENKPAYNYLKNSSPVQGETVVYVEYVVDKYGLTFETMEPADGEDPDSYIKLRYNLNDLDRQFTGALKNSGCTQTAENLIKEILHMGKHDDVSKRLGLEYAALSHHDNCRSGLLAHMTKCLQMYNGIKSPYAFLQDERFNDLMVIGLAIHDVGKIWEMYNGSYQKHSCVTHRGLGLEHLMQYKQEITEVYDEDFYYMLFSIIQQHHDEYGENAKTLCAYLVHLIDDMDAKLTALDQLLENGVDETDPAGPKIKLNGNYYSL